MLPRERDVFYIRHIFFNFLLKHDVMLMYHTILFIREKLKMYDI